MKGDGLKMSRQILEILSRAPALDLTNKQTLIGRLVLNYHVMVATGPLLLTAIHSLHTDHPLRGYLERHHLEESEHASWLRDDLESAGIDVYANPPPMIAIEIAGSAYYSILHVSPVSLLGYMLTLESVPRNTAMLKTLEELHGKQLLRTVRFHAQVDWKHTAEMITMIDIHTQSRPEDLKFIERQAILTCTQMLRAARELRDLSMLTYHAA